MNMFDKIILLSKKCGGYYCRKHFKAYETMTEILKHMLCLK